ncbi:MAG: 3-dehydroquinate synthase [Saprospiraceae bacterium]|nr:3-dehydroquinate synthase [Saprospiraceae bacterium]
MPLADKPQEFDRISLPGCEILVGPCVAELRSLVGKLNPSMVVILVDQHTEEYCLPILKEEGIAFDHTITIPAGEKHKSLPTCEKIWQRLFAFKADRRSLLINLGGGVAGDMGGFCASTYMRGMPFIQIPTTLLSQVDASIGGKLGIDFYGLKNSIGLFQDPVCVLVDPIFLQTLPAKELRSGFAEVIKHGLIRDHILWQKISGSADWARQNWDEVIHTSILIKKEVVEEDPQEKALRKILNFGHTIGHAIESVMIEIEKPILHGEAIAAGMIAESYLSQVGGTLPQKELAKIGDYLLSIYGKLDLDNVPVDSLIKKMLHDKKNVGEEINFTFLDRIGRASINHSASRDLIRESLDYYQSL